VATANAPGMEALFGYDVTDALRHTWVIGPNGVGKSTLLLNLIVQDLEANRPVVIEPKDLITDLLARPPSRVLRGGAGSADSVSAVSAFGSIAPRSSTT
jgi:hypothetical protein